MIVLINGPTSLCSFIATHKKKAFNKKKVRKERKKAVAHERKKKEEIKVRKKVREKRGEKKRKKKRKEKTSPIRQRCVQTVSLRVLTLALDLDGQIDEKTKCHKRLTKPPYDCLT